MIYDEITKVTQNDEHNDLDRFRTPNHVPYIMYGVCVYCIAYKELTSLLKGSITPFIYKIFIFKAMNQRSSKSSIINLFLQNFGGVCFNSVLSQLHLTWSV